MQRFILLVLFAVSITSGYAQVSFTADTNYVETSYPANAYVFYPWIEITNNTGALLEMRCVKVQDRKPAGWDTWLEDLDSLYRGIPDTTTFFMPAVNGPAQYIIVSFFPDNIEGRSTVALKLFPANNPADSALLTFQGNAYRVLTDVSEPQPWLADGLLYPQPTSGDVHITTTEAHLVTSIAIINTLGQQLAAPWATSTNTITIGTQALPTGLYYIALINQEGQVAIKRLMKD